MADAVAEVRLTMDREASPAGAVTATIAPPDARAEWSGSATGELRIGGRAANYSAFAADGTEVVARVRVELPPTSPVRVGIRCNAAYGTRAPADGAGTLVEWKLRGTPGGALLDVTAALSAARVGTWQTVRIPLAYIGRLGATFENVSSLFTIETAGRFAVTLRDVRLARGAAGVTCPAPGT